MFDLTTLPHSPTGPPPAQASSVASVLSIAKLIMNRHVRIAFFRFAFVHLTHITSRLLIALFPMTLRIPLHHHLRRTHADAYSLPVSLCQPPAIIFPLPPNTTRDIIICPNRRQDQATRRARQAHAQPQRLAAQQQPQLKSHSPAPLRTLLQL